jgi:hypothetical protein
MMAGWKWKQGMRVIQFNSATYIVQTLMVQVVSQWQYLLEEEQGLNCVAVLHHLCLGGRIDVELMLEIIISRLFSRNPIDSSAGTPLTAGLSNGICTGSSSGGRAGGCDKDHAISTIVSSMAQSGSMAQRCADCLIPLWRDAAM